MRAALQIVIVLVICAGVARADAGLVLTPEIARGAKGDGPDGTGNTGDDTWQFWLQVIHDRSLFIRLTLPTQLLSEQERKNGRRRKFWGPIASTTPNPKDTEGWIYHSDWDGKAEGVWGDTKAKQVLVKPYQEKADGGAIAITCKVPADGEYVVSGKATDLDVRKKGRGVTGIKVWVDVVLPGDGKSHKKRVKALVKPIACGDAAGPESVAFDSGKVALKKGQLVRLVIDPNRVAVGDMTRIDSFKVMPAK